MKGLSKLGISLTVVFAVCLIALIIDALYVLWRRRNFRRRSRAVEYPEEEQQVYSPSKELLYFFCWKSRTCVEPAASPQSGDDELARWEKLYGPSRILFTIKEEEWEEDEADQNRCSKESDVKEETRVCLEDVVVVVPAEEVVEDATPFSTPCASPPYYTPSPSPPRGTEDI